MLADVSSLFRAEWCKVVGNRRVTLFMIWIFPIAATAAAVLMPVLALALAEARAVFRSGALALEVWSGLAPEIWNLPNSWLGRMLLVGFATFVFAGEYQWRTWKNIVPRSQRASLILAKFAIVGALTVLAFASAMAILGVGIVVTVGLAGGTWAGLPGDELAELAVEYACQAGLTLVSTVIAAGYAALAAIYTRSILGGVLIGLGAAAGDQLFLLVLAQLGGWLNDLSLLRAYRLTPSYNVANLAAWINDGAPTTMLLGLASDGPAFSLAVLGAWVVGLVSLAVLLFQRQDIAS